MATKYQFYSIFLLLISFQLSHSLVEDVIEVITIGKELLSGINEAWSLVEQTKLADGVDLPFIKRREEKILRKMEQLTQQIHDSEDYMLNTAYITINTINKCIQTNSRLDKALDDLTEIIHKIDFLDDQMQNYNQHIRTIEKTTLEDFATGVVSSEYGVQNVLEKMQMIFSGPGHSVLSKPGVLDLIIDHMEQAKQTTCTYGLSAQQIVYQLYNAISITELKGYSMMQFSWMLLSTYGKGNFTTESQLMRNAFEKRINKTQNVLQQVMKRADREVWRCDPSNNRHLEGSTYLQVTRLLQGYIENEVDMNTDNTCRENCGYYQHGVRQETCYKDLYCARQPKCNGKMYDCQYVDSDMWICPASASSNRRYEYIEYESGRVLGEKKYCKRGTTKVDSWWRWLFWHCSYCFCVCDDAGFNSDRYISLRETASDISNNMVVTGVRFVKKNRIIHLQIQQGKLLPRGKIDNTTLKWIEPSNFRHLDGNVKNGVDYHTFSYHDRAIDLDDLKAPDGYVITGLKFRKVGTHLNLEATVTEINFKTGEIIEPSVQISNDKTENSDERRTEIMLKNPNIPIKSTNPSIPMSWSNQFVRLQASDYEKDAAQTTVPFFDAQPCISSTPTPLSGIGLFLKGQNLYGGFITPKIFTYDLGPHIQKPTA